MSNYKIIISSTGKPMGTPGDNDDALPYISISIVSDRYTIDAGKIAVSDEDIQMIDSAIRQAEAVEEIVQEDDKWIGGTG